MAVHNVGTYKDMFGVSEECSHCATRNCEGYMAVEPPAGAAKVVQIDDHGSPSNLGSRQRVDAESDENDSY
eukprot:12357436-Karenia_brevis.AAC.1